MTPDERLRMTKALGRLEDEAARLAVVDADAQRYVERAASCLRQRLATPVRPATFLQRVMDDQRRGAAAVDGIRFP